MFHFLSAKRLLMRVCEVNAVPVSAPYTVSSCLISSQKPHADWFCGFFAALGCFSRQHAIPTNQNLLTLS
jgi:hypothetical protein